MLIIFKPPFSEVDALNRKEIYKLNVTKLRNEKSNEKKEI